jgi:hypothetical protein
MKPGLRIFQVRRTEEVAVLLSGNSKLARLEAKFNGKIAPGLCCDLLAGEVVPAVAILAGRHDGLAEEADGEVDPEAAGQPQRCRHMVAATVAHDPGVDHVRLRGLHRSSATSPPISHTQSRSWPQKFSTLPIRCNLVLRIRIWDPVSF